MRLLKAGLLLIALSGLCASGLQAYEKGDFAPRGSLLYSRINDLSGALQKLGGEDWKAQAERMLLARNQRDFEESEPLVAEIRRFVEAAGATEFIIGDVMVREPFIQSATIVALKEGGPTEFSEAFRGFVKDNDRDAEVKPDSIKFEGVGLRISKGHLIITTGGMMDAHVQDVLEGFTDESLSQVERFTKWSSKANGDILLFADMKAWRAALDRLGEDFDAEVRQALEIVEWQKWDLITGSVSLPGRSGGLSADLSLSLNQPFSKLNAFLKPSGGSRLVSLLPGECVGFLTGQLGANHQQTYDELLRFFHDFEQDQRPARLRRRIEWAENDLRWAEERLAAIEGEKDKDAAPDPDPQDKPVEIQPEGSPEEETPESRKQRLKDEIAEHKQQIEDLKAQLAGLKYRPFEPDREARKDRRTEAEEFHDEIGQVFEQFGFTRDEALAAIGREALLGILNLPDPGFDDNDLDDAFEDMWFVLVETQDSFADLKEKFLDRMLARKFPDEMPEEERARAKEQASELMFKQVEGGEILRGRGLSADWCAFGGEGFVGFAPNEEVALRILKSAAGQGRMAVSSIPGGVSGSKFAYANLRDILQKLVSGNFNRDRINGRFPEPHLDLAKYLPGGFHLALASDEGSHGVGFTLRAAGEPNLAPVMKMFADEIHQSMALRHDREMLYELSNAIESWCGANTEAVKELGDAERGRYIKAVTPQSLMEGGLFSPLDGMRSAFEPAMAERFKAMLEAHAEHMLKEGEDPTDLSAGSYEWFGLPADLQYSDERAWFRADDRNPWIICQLKGDWARNGRLCLIWDGRVRSRWYPAEELQRLREAISRGETWRPLDKAGDAPPSWRARRLMARKQWEMDELYQRLVQARQALKDQGKDARISFKGGEHNPEQAVAELRKLLGVSEEDWFYFQDANNLTVETKPDGRIKVKFEKWGQWIEIDEIDPESDPENYRGFNLKTSFDE
jgi:hypothetical protein